MYPPVHQLRSALSSASLPNTFFGRHCPSSSTATSPYDERSRSCCGSFSRCGSSKPAKLNQNAAASSIRSNSSTSSNRYSTCSSSSRSYEPLMTGGSTLRCTIIPPVPPPPAPPRDAPPAQPVGPHRLPP